MAEAFEKDIERLSREVKEIVKSPEWESRSAKEAVQQVLRPLVYAQGKKDEKGAAAETGLPAYVQEAPENVKIKIEHLLSLVFKHGLEKAAAKARQDSPFVLDAFHDALVDKFYEELKKRQIIK